MNFISNPSPQPPPPPSTSPPHTPTHNNSNNNNDDYNIQPITIPLTSAPHHLKQRNKTKKVNYFIFIH